MDPAIANYLHILLPLEIVEEIDGHLREMYRRENAQKLREMALKHKFFITERLGILMYAPRGHEMRAVVRRVCKVCGDLTMTARYKDGNFAGGEDVYREIQKSHSRGCKKV